MALGNEQLDIFCPSKNLIVQSVSFAVSSKKKVVGLLILAYLLSGYPESARLLGRY